jgi:hypothetical protein
MKDRNERQKEMHQSRERQGRIMHSNEDTCANRTDVQKKRI